MNTQIKDIGMRLASLRDDFEISIEEMAQKLGEDVETYNSCWQQFRLNQPQSSHQTPSSLKDIDQSLTYIPKLFLQEADPPPGENY